MYDAVARELASPSPVPERVELLAARARRQYAKQREYREYTRSNRLGCAPDEGSLWYSIRTVLGVLLFATAGVGLCAGGWPWVLAFIVVGAALGAMLVVRAKRNQEDGRPRTCHRCGYDLAGTSGPIPAEILGVDLGPRVCSECGADWPMSPELGMDPTRPPGPQWPAIS